MNKAGYKCSIFAETQQSFYGPINLSL